MKRVKHLGALVAALLAIGCATAPLPGQVAGQGPQPPTRGKAAPNDVDVLRTADATGYRLLAETRFPAPIASVTASSTREEAWLDVANVTDGRLTSAWGPGSCEGDPSLTFYLEDLVTIDELALKLSLGQYSSPANHRVFVDVQASADGGATWATVATGLNPAETALGSFAFPATRADAVRLVFRAPGEDICDLLVCYANFIDPVDSWPSPAPSYWPSSPPSNPPSWAPSWAPSWEPSTDPSPTPSTSQSSAPSPTPSTYESTAPTPTPSTYQSTAPTPTPSTSQSSAPTPTPSTYQSTAPTPTPSTSSSSTPSTRPSPVPSYGTSGCGTYMSYTPGAWGAAPNGGNAGSILHDNWEVIEAADGADDGRITIGVGPNVFTFTSAQAITDFLPASGGNTPIAASATNPTSGGSTLISHTTALKLEVLAAGYNLTADLGAVVYTGGGPLNGYTIDAILLLAEQYIGGSITTLPGGLTPADLIGIVASINLFFEPTGTPDGVTFSCPGSAP